MNDSYQQGREILSRALAKCLLPMATTLRTLHQFSEHAHQCAWSLWDFQTPCYCGSQLWPPFLANQSRDAAKKLGNTAFSGSVSQCFSHVWLGQFHFSNSVDRKYVLRILAFRMFFSHLGDLMWHRKY